MRRVTAAWALGVWAISGGPLALAAEEAPLAGRGPYAVVISPETLALPEWRAVADVLVEKHGGVLVEGRPGDEGLRERLRELHPAHTCLVARPEEAGHDAVLAMHRLARGLDEDPYTDTFWGILTGYTAEDALGIARETAPLEVRKVLSGTEVALDRCVSGRWYCELVPNKTVVKAEGGTPQEERGPADTTAALAEALNAGPDLFVTSGHATERDWQVGFRYRNGTFRCAEGRLYGLDTAGGRHPVDSPNPKVYLPIGNCLMGNIPDRECMALAFLHSAGVRQMLGYVEPTWYGYAGWGVLDYFVEQPGRYTLTEAFFANQHALDHRLESGAAKTGTAERPAGGEGEEAVRLRALDVRGLEFDRERVAFFGDPAWEARMAPGPLNWEQELSEEDGVFRLTIRPLRGAASFEPVNTNGSQRGGRPWVAYLTHRIDPASVEILSGAEFTPVVADDFVLVPLPAACDPQRDYSVRFRAVRR